MRSAKTFLFAGILAILLIQTGAPRPQQQKAATAGDTQTDTDVTTYIAANNLLMFATNTGVLARDVDGVFGYDIGFFYPFTTVDDITMGVNTTSALYAAGIWVGGLVNDSIRIGMSQYSSEFWPGPMSGGTFDPNGDTEPTYRVYKLYSDSLAGNPNSDYTNWPTAQGAPVDGLGHPAIRGDQLLWSVFNDANQATHTILGGETEPVGVEIQQMVWASDDPGQENVIFVQYTIFNRSSNVVDSCFVTFWMDPDLGWAEDDLVGCDSADNIIFCYNGDNDDGQYGTTPPAIGVRMIRGPLLPSTGDTAIFDRSTVPDHKNLDFFSVAAYPTGADPADSLESWNVMRGLDVSGAAIINPISTQPSRFEFTGDPVSATGWLDSSPADRAIIATAGPFTFNPGDSQCVLYKIAVGQAGDRLSSLTNLRSVLLSEAGSPTGLDDGYDNELPRSFALMQNYPNPFNPETVIRYSLPTASTVTITVHNILGRQVATLIDSYQSAGTHDVVWDGTNLYGEQVASGVYFYRLRTEQGVDSRKMILLR